MCSLESLFRERKGAADESGSSLYAGAPVMRFFDWLWKRRSRNTADTRMTDIEKTLVYLRERGIEYELGKDEVPFAVIWPTASAGEQPLRELGEQLRQWAARNGGVKRILGLERLLEGRRPAVSAFLLMIPFCPQEPESCIERVALVVVKCNANTAELAESLCQLVERSGVAKVTSWEQYSYMTR